MMRLAGAKTILVLLIPFFVLLCSCLGVKGQSPRTTTRQTSPDFTKEHQLLQQGKYDEAIAELQNLASEHPDSKGIYRELGIAYYKKNDYVQAVHSLQQALQEDPQD